MPILIAVCLCADCAKVFSDLRNDWIVMNLIWHALGEKSFPLMFATVQSFVGDMLTGWLAGWRVSVSELSSATDKRLVLPPGIVARLTCLKRQHFLHCCCFSCLTLHYLSLEWFYCFLHFVLFLFLCAISYGFYINYAAVLNFLTFKFWSLM